VDNRDVRVMVRRIAIDISPLRQSRDYRLVWTGQLISLIGRQVTVVAVPFQVFQLTGSSVAVGLIGVFQVVPYILLSLVGGTIADRVDRRRLLLTTQVLLAASSSVLTLATILRFASLPVLYTMVGVISAISAVNQPAQAAMTPNLVPRNKLSAAMALNFAQFQSSLIVGPAVAGLVIARFGLATGYGIDVATFGAALLALALIPAQPPHETRDETPLQSVVQGFRFVLGQGAVLGGFAVDLNAMFFGMPRALFPVLALGTFHAGPAGLGLLHAGLGFGSVVGSLFSGFVAHVRRQGLAVIVAAAGWGVCIALFALATFSIWAAVSLLVLAGACDSVSAIARNTILQTVTPDRLRGRASASYSMVVVGGPMLGDLRAGTMAGAFGPELSLLVGGLACIAGSAVLARLFPALSRYDAGTVAPVRMTPEAAERDLGG
jgi:MFS family permease